MTTKASKGKGQENAGKVLPQMGVLEIRAFSAPDLKAQAEDSVIDGHAAVFDQKANIGGFFYEVIERGAFDKTDFRDVLMSVVNHDMRRLPVARSRNNNVNSTLQLSVDGQGLYTKAALDTERNFEARALYSAIDRGDVSGMSAAFYVADAEWEDLDTDMPTRRIKAISRVVEVTPASIPAYEGTDIQARDQFALDSAKRTLDSARSRLESRQSQETEAVRHEREIEVLKLRTLIRLKEE